MAKQQRSTMRYSIGFKQKVVREIEAEGLTFDQARRRYGIGGGSTLQKWVAAFGKHQLLNKIVRIEMKGEKDRVKELEAEVKKLKLALADATLEKRALETLVEVMGEHYGVDAKKNFAHRLSNERVKNKGVR